MFNKEDVHLYCILAIAHKLEIEYTLTEQQKERIKSINGIVDEYIALEETPRNQKLWEEGYEKFANLVKEIITEL